MEYRVEDRIYKLKKGDLLLINPQELHQPLVTPETKGYERIVLWINKNFLHGFGSYETELTHCFNNHLHSNLLRPEAPDLTTVTSKLHDLLWEYYNDRFGRELCSQGVFIQLMVELNRLSMKNSTATVYEPILNSRPLVTRVLTYIGTHFSKKNNP